MGTLDDRSAWLLKGSDYAGTVKAAFPLWDDYFRPYLLEAIELLPAAKFDFKPQPDMFTARQVILHIAETERYWVHHIVEGEPYEDFVVRHEDPAQGWVTRYDAPDHNSMCFALEEYHRHTQRLFGLPAKELDRTVTFTPRGAPPEQYSLHWILGHVEEHELHHRAQLSIYLRMLGIAPPQL
jgi:uncharacterized damage-inducible protein DinB